MCARSRTTPDPVPGGLPTLLIGWAVLQAIAFALFAQDKSAAREHRRRIRERTLLLAGLWGGIGAVLACLMLRHKTSKEPFRTRLIAAAAAHVIATGAVVRLLS